jgi:hypothetical protein
MPLVITLISAACSQFDKLNSAVLFNRQEHITPHHGQEDEQVYTLGNRELQAKLSACIRHHQDIME